METRPKQGGHSPFSAPDPKPSGAGMGSLLSGQPAPPTPARARVPRWYLFGADLLLVAVALIVLAKHPAPMTGLEKVFGVLAVVLGAGLAVIATCMRDRKGS